MIEVRAQAVVLGATDVMARSMPSAADSVGARSRAGPQLLPAQAVDHQQHDLAGLSGRRRQPAGPGDPLVVPEPAGPGPRWRCRHRRSRAAPGGHRSGGAVVPDAEGARDEGAGDAGTGADCRRPPEWDRLRGPFVTGINSRGPASAPGEQGPHRLVAVAVTRCADGRHQVMGFEPEGGGQVLARSRSRRATSRARSARGSSTGSQLSLRPHPNRTHTDRSPMRRNSTGPLVGDNRASEGRKPRNSQ